MRSREEAPAGTPVTFADAAEAWLLHGERKRALKRSTLVDYRQALDAHVLPAPPQGAEPDTAYGRVPFATTPVREIRSEQLKDWYERLPTGRTADKLLMIVRGILVHARSRGWAGGADAAGPAQRPGGAGQRPAGPGGAGQPAEIGVERRAVGDWAGHDVYSPAEVDALVRAAANAQDAAIFLTAATTGLRRGELIALRWRDVDHAGRAIRVRANFSDGELVTPRSGKVRTTPMTADVADALAGLAERELFTAEHDPVFTGTVGGFLDGSALSRRYARAAKRAGLRPLPFHSLRHHFGATAVNRASLVEVQSWMGHAEIQTTARYLAAVSCASRA